MKKYMFLMILVTIAVISIGARNFQSAKQAMFAYPVEVKKVIDDKCYGCHSTEGKSQKAKDALMWDNLPGLQKRKVVAKLDKITEVLDDGSMPPEEFLKKFPEAKLLAAEKDVLRSWADAKADSIMK